MLIGFASREKGIYDDKVINCWLELVESGYAYWNEADKDEVT